MNYYRINSSLDPAVIGNIPFGQAYTAEYPCAAEDPMLVSNNLFVRKDPEEVLVQTPILRPKAKLTDLISGLALGQNIQLMISDRLKSILETAGHHGLQFFPMDVMHRGKQLSGFWVAHPVGFDMELIDYSKSKMEVDGYGGIKLREETVPDFNSFLALKEKTVYPERLRISEVFIRPDADQPILLLRDVWEGVGYYVSETLKQQIEDQHCTGIAFSLPHERYPV